MNSPESLATAYLSGEFVIVVVIRNIFVVRY
jgi:hypothetical protein